MAIQLGIFLITLSGLMFEIGLTRIFSATIWYHFAFVAISVALLGWGLGGFALHLLKDRVQLSLEKAAVLTLLYALSIPLSLWLIVSNPFHPERLSYYFAYSLLPFLLAGAALSMVFTLQREAAGKLYFADLLGASSGALAVTFLLSWLGGERAVLTVALAPVLAAACFSRRLWPASAAGVALVAGALLAHAQLGLFSIRSAPTKGMYQHMAAEPRARLALTGWNAYSRIDAVTGYSDSLARLYIDSDAWTGLHRWDGSVNSIHLMRDWYRALPFKLVKEPETLVIGPGGGSDVLVGLASGSRRVTAVEMNPLMLRFVRHYGAEAGNLYDHPQVETVLSEGRNFLSRTERRFDVIFLGFVDSWAAVASGGLSLSENYLYTTEAFRAYYDHLTPDGVLVIMRWRSDIPRLVTNSVALLGASEAASRVAVLVERRGTEADPSQMIFMLRRRPFTEAEGAMMAREWQEAEPIIVPGQVAQPPYDGLLSGRETMDEFVAEATTRVDPVFDDRPFYFARQKPWGIPGNMARSLLFVLAPILIGCVALVALGRPRGQDGPYRASVLYFASLGLGFIVVELALLQNLTLLLGHPIFTLSVLLFTLLAAGGVGSHFSARFAMRTVCLVIAGASAVAALVLPELVPALLPLPLVPRLLIAVALVAPLGFAMGMPFPRGLRRVGQGALPAPAFYWGLNGVLSVIGSIGTMLIAVSLGFRAAMLAGAACYVLAALNAGFVGGPTEAAAAVAD
jgi:predicted membrane-bound spermidine synthase